MILRGFFELISDSVFALRSGMSFRFVLANIIMRDELRQAVAFATALLYDIFNKSWIMN